jgi:putative transposase
MQRYQIEEQRAVQQFQRLAAEKNPAIQMIVALAEVAGLLQEGVGHLLRQAGLELMRLVMEEEVRQLAGERYQQHPERRAHRWGQEDGYCVVDGQKVPIRRRRLRDQHNRELCLGSYEMFQRNRPDTVWDKLMRGLSTRNYGAVVKEFRDAYGVQNRRSATASSLLAGRS